MNDHIYNNKLIIEAEKKTFEKIDSFILMKKAAKKCYDYINKNYSSKKILILCGPGNNGGDGAMLANYLLNNNYFVHVNYPLSRPRTQDSKKAYSFIENKNVLLQELVLEGYDIIIDSIFGIGLKRKFNEDTIKLIKTINQSKAHIISIDVPSGILIDNGLIDQIAIKANLTLTFHRYKPCHWILPGKEYCGKTILLDIGLVNLDSSSNTYLNGQIKPLEPFAQDNKFTRGSCFIIAGTNLVGAGKLAFLSASQSVLRAGSGLCKLLVHDSQTDIFKPHILEEMLITYSNIDQLKKILNNTHCNSIIYGCGIENNIFNIDILKFLITCPISLVLDAAVFSMIESNKRKFFSLLKLRSSSTIMTPHAGEFKRIFKVTNDKISDCICAAKESNCTIVYKGNDTVIGLPTGKAIIDPFSSPYLATAGSGDVLCGIIGSFLAQGLSSSKASRLGTYIHSKCGINLGPGLIASDLIKEIPKVIKSII